MDFYPCVLSPTLTLGRALGPYFCEEAATNQGFQNSQGRLAVGVPAVSPTMLAETDAYHGT